jgi:hypothetical protein
MTIDISLPDDVALVLFEMLSREVDDRQGRELAPALVEEAEYWALNWLLGALERTVPNIFAADYPAQVRAARAQLTPSPEDTHFTVMRHGVEISIKPRGRESDAMGEDEDEARPAGLK